jgi:hypothetical protein
VKIDNKVVQAVKSRYSARDVSALPPISVRTVRIIVKVMLTAKVRENTIRLRQMDRRMALP